MRYFWLLLLFGLTACGMVHPPKPPQPSYESWLAGVRAEAAAKGISEPVLNDALGDLYEPSPTVLLLDHAQPEKTLSFEAYYAKVITARKVADGKAHWRSHEALLKRISAAYGVPAPILLALWGIESNYGDRQGTFPIVDSLATLAYDGRRRAFFHDQLMDALILLQQEHKPSEELVGSWAGAMGQIQFMPSSFLQFAVDFDGDGKKDIWNSDADALASMANYLHQRGWQSTEGWGMRVSIPLGFAVNERIGDMPVSQWQRLGLRKEDGANLPQIPAMARLVLPDDNLGVAFLVFSNYNVLMDWNRSTYFATAVGLLADAIEKP